MMVMEEGDGSPLPRFCDEDGAEGAPTPLEDRVYRGRVVRLDVDRVFDEPGGVEPSSTPAPWCFYPSLPVPGSPAFRLASMTSPPKSPKLHD